MRKVTYIHCSHSVLHAVCRARIGRHAADDIGMLVICQAGLFCILVSWLAVRYCTSTLIPVRARQDRFQAPRRGLVMLVDHAAPRRDADLR